MTAHNKHTSPATAAVVVAIAGTMRPAMRFVRKRSTGVMPYISARKFWNTSKGTEKTTFISLNFKKQLTSVTVAKNEVATGDTSNTFITKNGSALNAKISKACLVVTCETVDWTIINKTQRWKNWISPSCFHTYQHLATVMSYYCMNGFIPDDIRNNQILQ